MRAITLIVTSRYPDIFTSFKQNVETCEPSLAKLLIRSGDAIPSPPGWLSLQGTEPFVFARNVNLGLTLTWPGDVIVCGDDVRFTGPFVEPMRRAAYSDNRVGVVVPTIQEGGQSIFVCCFIRRDVIEHVGYLDERFDRYGYEDNDFYTRYEALGYHTQPCPEVVISHHGGTSYFRRRDEGGDDPMQGVREMKKKFEEKWPTKS